jgi:hypothetical protein
VRGNVPTDRYDRADLWEEGHVNIRRRLGDAARITTRAGRGLGRGAEAAAPQARYARVLDGEHLWLAVPADAGRPMLWDEAADRAVDVVDGLPPGHAEHDPSCVSVRWRLGDALPESEGAQLLVVVVTGDGDPVPVLRPPRPPASSLRIPPTADRRWRFALPAENDGLLRVRRTRAASVAVLDSIRPTGPTVTLVCTTPHEVAPRLLFQGKGERGAEHSIPMTVDEGRYTASVGLAELPERPGGYRLAIGTPEENLTIARHHNDLHIDDTGSVLLPLVLDADAAEVVGRFVFNNQGVLRVVRRDAATDAPAEASA